MHIYCWSLKNMRHKHTCTDLNYFISDLNARFNQYCRYLFYSTGVYLAGPEEREKATASNIQRVTCHDACQLSRKLPPCLVFWFGYQLGGFGGWFLSLLFLFFFPSGSFPNLLNILTLNFPTYTSLKSEL